jgi:hypothetical protein
MSVSMGFLIPRRGNETRVEGIELMCKPRIRRRKALSRKSRKDMPVFLRYELAALLASAGKDPIPGYVHFVTAEIIDKILSEKYIIKNFAELVRDVRSTLVSMGLPEVGERSLREDLNVLAHLLRGLGCIEIFEKGAVKYVAPTKLGATLRDVLGLQPTEKEIAIASLISTAFSTKARVVFGLYGSLGLSPQNYYVTLRRTALVWREGPNYEGMERVALEVLGELHLTNAFSSEEYVSEAQLLLQLFRGLHDRYGDCLIEAFKAVNRDLRFPNVKPDEKYRAGAWDLLQPGTVSSVKEIEEKCGLRGLKNALDSIRDKFVEIEQQMVALYGLVERF